MYIYVHIYIYICMYVYIYIYQNGSHNGSRFRPQVWANLDFLQPGTCPEGQRPGKTLGAQERCRPRWRRWQWWTPAWTIINIFNIDVNMNSLLFVWNFHLAVGICLVSTSKFLRGANDSLCQVCLTAFACQTRPEEFFQKFQWLWFECSTSMLLCSGKWSLGKLNAGKSEEIWRPT